MASMKRACSLGTAMASVLMIGGVITAWAWQVPATGATTAKLEAPCDIYAAAGAPCVAAHSSTRALYAAYKGPLYQVIRESDGKTLDIGVVASSVTEPGGYADAAAQDAFCEGTYCYVSVLYDQSGHHNDLVQAPRGGFSGPALGGFNNLPRADMAPVSLMGHKVYGVFIAPGTGLRLNDAKGTAVDDQAEGQYWVINGQHFNSGCCFDYGNAETDSRDDGNGTMETTFYGNTPWWFHGNPPGPWIMTDQENNLVGCANSDKSKLCATLPNISWRFVTAMAKGEPHHWTTLGGDARQGTLWVMFDGRRVDATYDPMRKQGAILLGNGGDNSHGSQGTFYEGVMTAAGTFPSDATDQQIQANIVAAHYDVPALTIAATESLAHPLGLQTFVPGSTRSTTLTFTNVSGEAVKNVKFSLAVPQGWTAVKIDGASRGRVVLPGESISAVFKVTSGLKPLKGELTGGVAWTSTAGKTWVEKTLEKVRNAAPVKINEFRISDGSPNVTNSFIELYNAGATPVDISGWSLTQNGSTRPVFSSIGIPAGTRLGAHKFYVLGLANSGLAAEASVGDSRVFLRNADGLKVGSDITIDGETRKVTRIGTPVGKPTTLWQPVPEGPVITIPAGGTNVPVESTEGFVAGEKIALGYGTTYPVIGRDTEKYEIATVTRVGKAGTQAYLSADATAGSLSIGVTSVENISPGDQIRLDIDSVGHGIETVTVKSVGTAATRTSVAADSAAGASTLTVRSGGGFPVREAYVFSPGEKLNVGTPASLEVVTVASVAPGGPGTVNLTLAAPLRSAHIADEDVVEPGTGLTLTAPLRYTHAANMPFSVRGTGLEFTPAAKMAHSSNEPVLPLGTGIELDTPLSRAHAIDSAVRFDASSAAGFQGKPDHWFGGPVLSIVGGSMALRDANGLVVDSLNYGELVSLSNAEGYQAESGLNKSGCFVPVPGVPQIWPPVNRVIANISAGRVHDGRDADSNCTDFAIPASTLLAVAAASGDTSLKVDAPGSFKVGQTVAVGLAGNQEFAVIAAVGSPGASSLGAPVQPGATKLAVADARTFTAGQIVVVDSGANKETATVTAVNGFGRELTLSQPLKMAHAADAVIAGMGLTLKRPLKKAHAAGAQVVTGLPTPGAANAYAQ